MQKYLAKFKKVIYSFLVIQILLITFPLTLFAYPEYQTNSDLVVAGPYDPAISGAANWGYTTSGYREFITVGQKYRIRQGGTLSRIKIYTVNKSNLTGFYVKIWRKNGSTYDLVGTSNNLVGNLVAGNYATIDLSAPIVGIQEGDYYGYLIEKSGTIYNFYAKPAGVGTRTYYIDNITPSELGYAWETKLSTADALPIELYMTAPQAAFIGDSIIAGHPAHYSFLETATTTNINSTIEKQFFDLTGYTYQNMGIGSQYTSNISARFTADIINSKPKIAVIEGGVNDIAGAIEKSIFIANWTSMLDAAQASDYITTIIVLKIMPWTGGTNAKMQTRDDWNASLATLAAGYSKAIVVDTSSYVGEFRVGGDAGNLWNIQAAYNADNVHFNQAGYGQIAQAIADSLPKPSATFDNDFSVWNAGNITANYNLIQTGGSTNTNISQTGLSGIEYSTDNLTWHDATKGVGGDALTGLSSSASPGTDHSFVWDSTTDMPLTEDSTVYLRIRPNDGTSNAADWVTSNTFGIDNIAPASVNEPTFGVITPNSIEIIKPTTITENGSGLGQWQVRRDSTTELGLNATTTTSVFDLSLAENTQYTYDAQFKDSAGNASSYGTSAQKYTLADTPTNFTASANPNSITLSVDSFTNDTSGSSGYYFSRSGSSANSGWIQTNSWSDTGLSCGTASYLVKYRNGAGVETDPVSVIASTNNCSSGGIPLSWSNPPSIPTGGFNVTVNQNIGTTSNRIVDLNSNAGPDIKKMAISLSGDFTDSSLEDYVPIKQIDLCSRFSGLIKDSVCPAGTYTIYVKFYTQYGQASEVFSEQVTLVAATPQTPIPPVVKPITKLTFTKDLKSGARDGQVKLLQKFLNQNGFKLTDNGLGSPGRETDFFGLLTYKALIKFQEANKIKASERGYLGLNTRNFINPLVNTLTTVKTVTAVSAIFTRNLYLGIVSEDVRRLQKLLATKPDIYPEGRVTGYYGPLTQAAVQRFQLKYAVVSSKTEKGFGVVGPKTRDKLKEVF